LCIGGVNNWTLINSTIGLVEGFSGSIQRLIVNGQVWDDLLTRAVTKQNINEFKGPPCFEENGSLKCLNNGTCAPKLNEFVCSCPARFGGQRCEKIISNENRAKPILFDGKTHFSFILNKNNFM